MSTLLAAAAPSVDFAWHKYLAAHDAVVSAPTYSRCAAFAAWYPPRSTLDIVARTVHGLRRMYVANTCHALFDDLAHWQRQQMPHPLCRTCR